MFIPAHAQIAAAYAKACIQNPKRTIADNMAAAFEACPHISRLCESGLLPAAETALDILREVAVADSGEPEQDAAEREAFDALQAAVNKAKGQ